MSTRIDFVIHAQNGTGLGHIRRMSVLCKELFNCRPDLNISVVTNALHTSFLYQLPLKIYHMPFNSIEEEKSFSAVKRNKEYFLSILRGSSPKVLIFDTLFDPDLVRSIQLMGTKVVLIQRIIDESILLKRIENGDYDNFDIIVFPHSQDSLNSTWHNIKNSSIGHKSFADGFVFTPIRSTYPKTNKSYEIIVTLGGGGPYFTRNGSNVYMNDHTKLGFKLLRVLSKLTPRSPNSKFCFCWGLNSSVNIIRESKEFYSKDNLLITGWIDNFTEALSNCQLCISRCGYNTICEIINTRCPSVLIPRNCRTESQLDRASWLSKQEACLLLEEEDINLDYHIQDLWEDTDKLTYMRESLSQIYLPSGTTIITKRLLDLLRS